MYLLGRLAQSGRALPLQGRSHIFEGQSNPVAPTKVFQKSLHIYTQKTPKRHKDWYWGNKSLL